jgi:hypothetical protein
MAVVTAMLQLLLLTFQVQYVIRRALEGQLEC